MKIDRVLRIILMLCIGCVLYLTMRALYAGAFAFWFDPARDLGLGLANLEKLSLIGHPSGGLPGIFYGPYYIWSISLAEVVSKDPRWVWFAVATIPYFTLFPLALYKLREYADLTALIALFLLFILSFNNHSQVWNPNPTPIMYLFALYFAVKSLFTKDGRFVFAALTGVVAGLIANYHISYGVGIILSFGLLYFADCAFSLIGKGRKVKGAVSRKILALFGFGGGVLVTYIPFFLFEVRHGFNQVRTILLNFQLGLTKGISLNVGHGFSKTEIVNYFFAQGEKLLHVSGAILVLTIVGSLIYLVVKARRNSKAVLSSSQIRLLAIVAVNAVVVLAVFLTARNPVYDYFFIGIEMFFLIIMAILASKIPVLKYGFVILALLLMVQRINSEVKSAGKKIMRSPDYGSKYRTAETMYRDADKSPFTVFIYDPAIYTYDYDYIFAMFEEKYGYMPKREKPGDNLVYVILPKQKDVGALQSFAQYHTPDTEYITVKRWVMDDGAVVIRKERKQR